MLSKAAVWKQFQPSKWDPSILDVNMHRGEFGILESSGTFRTQGI